MSAVELNKELSCLWAPLAVFYFSPNEEQLL